MTQDKKHELLTLPEIFNNGNRHFIIPDYQRGYSWEKEHREDLLNDIKEIIKNLKNSDSHYKHYTGTIVATPIDNNRYEIVDGQQRLTTLVMLLSNIALKLPAEYRQEIYNLYLTSDKKAGEQSYKFLPGQEQKALFKKLTTHQRYDAIDIENKSDRNLVEGYEQFEKWCSSDENKNKLPDIYETVTKRLGFLFYTPESNNEVSIMFEVINNRGKQLSELEKIKNHIVYVACKDTNESLRENVNEVWPKILKHLQKCHLTSNNEEDSFLRHCWIVFQDNFKLRDLHVYDELKEIEDSDKLNEFVTFMDRASLTHLKLFTRDEVEDSNEKLWLERLSWQNSISSIMPLVISVYEKIENKSDRQHLIELIEKLNFRFYGAAIARRSDSGQADLFKYAHTFYHYYGKADPGDKNTIVDESWLTQKLIDFVDREANDAAFIKNLTLDKDESGDYYHWHSLKYFLANYELCLMDNKNQTRSLGDFFVTREEIKDGSKQKNDIFHREHILAQNDPTKIKKGNKGHEALIGLQRRRLGNFMLLNAGSNKSEGKNPPEHKVEEYAKWSQDKGCFANTYMVKELKEDWNKAESNMSKWERRTEGYWHELYQRFFDIREEKMVKFALERWRVEGITTNIDIDKITINSLTDDNRVYNSLVDEGQEESYIRIKQKIRISMKILKLSVIMMILQYWPGNFAV